ncbi:two pore domain potassium channel family protein [Bacillus sp. MB95]|nr:hypothetical protein [Bacillus sp. MB95]
MTFTKKRQNKLKIDMRFVSKTRLPLSEEYRNKTLEEFIEYETKGKSKLASLAYSWKAADYDQEVQNFEFKVDYYWNCVEDLKEVSKDIMELWKELFRIFDKISSKSTLELYLGILAAISAEAGFNQELKSDLDNKLTTLVYDSFNEELNTRGLRTVLNKIINWFNFKANIYYRDLKLGVAERELEYLQKLYEAYESDFEKLKTELPRAFLRYFNCVNYYYKNLPQTTDYNYDEFFNQVLLGAITASKNSTDFKLMSNLIYLYHKEMKGRTKGKIQRIGLNILDYCTGYGEKPFRLISIYIALQVIFLFINFPYEGSVLQFEGLESTGGIWDKLVGTVYFNSTTMLTSVYGDISPSNALARLVVVIQQLLGFVVSASFLTLLLRKLFRF